MEDPSPHNQSQHLEALSFLSFEQDSGGLPAVGDDIGEYVLLSVLGRGATGVVFEAQQKSLDRRVALKLIPLVAADRTAAGKARLEREGRLLASMQHPNIIEVFDTGLTPDYRWLAMKLIRGANLGEVLAGRADGLPSPESPDWLSFILPVLHQIASALASAHDRGIVHRDIKPSNILLDEDGVPHLVDFGLADSDAHILETNTTGFIGTPLYASPEQARGEPLTAASDVFSFGAVAFESLNGEVPFKGSNTRELLRNIQFADPVWKNPRAIPLDVRAVVEKCLEKRIPDGYADSSDVAEEFARFLRFEPVHAVPRGSLSRWWQRTMRKPGRAVVSVSLAVLTIAAMVSGLVVQIQGSQLEEFRNQAQYKEAESAWHHGLLSTFFNHLQELPRSDRLRLQADALLIEDKHEEAYELYQKIALRPDSLADQLANVLASKPRDTGALPELPQGIQAKTSRDWLILCLYYNQCGQYQQTLEAVQEARTHFSFSYPLDYLQGFAFRGLGLADDAIHSFQNALAKHADSVQSLRQLARVLKGANRFEEAESILQQGLELDPDNELLWADLANLYMINRQPDKAIKPLRRAAELDPDLMRPWVTSVRAQALMKQQKHEQAEELLQQGLDARPNAWHVVNRMAALQLKLKEWEKALVLADDLVEQPFIGWQSRGYFTRGHALFQLGRFDESLEAFKQCTKLRPDMDSYNWFSAREVIEVGEYDVLQSFLDFALETNPRQFDSLIMSVELRLLRAEPGDLEDAHDFAIRAVGVEPKSAQAHYWLARSLYEMGKPEMAMARVALALELDSELMPAQFLKLRIVDPAAADKAEAEAAEAAAAEEALKQRR